MEAKNSLSPRPPLIYKSIQYINSSKLGQKLVQKLVQERIKSFFL
jgi:hypothetical protein